MGKINVLGFDVANLIAAGEVVDRPASVVKELCENSIDAGARHIAVEIRHGGTSYIRVSDDGHGIDPEDVPLTVLRHATSKIATAEDLAAIGTLGFRGEALAAIASVCKLRMMTRARGGPMGVMMTCEGGEIVDVSEYGCTEGTTILVSELFYNVPARRKFLKKDVSEGAAVTAVMEKIAVSSPDISIKYIQDGQIKFMTNGSGKLIDTIFAVFGKETAKRMTPVDKTDMNGIRISGYIGEPDLVRSNKNSENFFINGRFVKSRTAMAAIEQAYSTRIPHSKFPVCILNIQLNPAIVDVNVHPSKLEVKFANERIIFEAVYYAVLGALETSVSRPEMRLGNVDTPFYDSSEKKGTRSDAYPVEPYKRKTGISAKDAFAPIETPKEERVERAQIKLDVHTETPRPRTELMAPSPSQAVRAEERPEPRHSPISVPTARSSVQAPLSVTVKQNEAPKTASAPEPEKPRAEKKNAPDFKILGEAYNCYVIVQLEDRLLMIDKHAAHERIIFDELCRNMESGEKTSQILMYPLRVPVREEEALALEEYRDRVCAMGFAYTYDKTRACLSVTEVPTHLGRDTGGDMLSELATVLSDATGSIESTGAKFFEAKLYQASCKAAIKAGYKNSTAEMKVLAEQVLYDNEVRYCPHGRPVLIELTKYEIEKLFGRIQ